VQTFQTYFQPVTNALRHPASLFTRTTTESSTLQPSNILSQARNMNVQQLAAVGIVLAEVVGFFSVGEMLGRLKIVGYRSSAPHSEH
jgi:F-type H+-transporting ATPase subunit g